MFIVRALLPFWVMRFLNLLISLILLLHSPPRFLQELSLRNSLYGLALQHFTPDFGAGFLFPRPLFQELDYFRLP